MKSNKIKIINTTLVIIVIVGVIIRFTTDNTITIFLSDAISLSIFGILLQRIIDYISDYNVKLLFQSIIYANKDVRVSFAYLFRINIDGIYFLIKGSKIQKFQPVGGVYQYFESAKSSIDGIFVSSDKMVENSIENQNDIRGYVKGKKLKEFITWFESRKNREIDCNREFIEELISTGILAKDKFKHITYRYIGSHHQGIFKTDRPGYEYEYLIADIYELVPTEHQKEEFRRLKKVFDEEKDIEKLSFAFASNDEIRARRLNKTPNSNHTENITNHTFKVLKETENELR